MTYDGEGHRTRLVQTPATGSATTIDFRYQGAAVAEETQTTSGGPTISRRFIVDDTGRAIKLSLAGDPVGANNGTYVIVWNGHGDATGLWQIKTDGTLEKANTFTYDTWGRPARTVYGAYTDLGFRYLYVGAADVQWDDAYGAGLLYMHARTYSPTLGRFLQPDPIAAEGNLYGYAENSPVTKADPSGTFAWCAIPFVGWAICSTVVRALAGAVGGFLVRNGQAIASRGPAIVNAIKDNAGRIREVTSTLSRANLNMGTRVTDAARRICCSGLTGYDAGHLIARVLGGPGGARADNIVAILTKVNRGVMAQWERQIKILQEKGYTIQVRIRPIYDGSGTVPSQIEYSYRVIGARVPWLTKTFDNK